MIDYNCVRGRVLRFAPGASRFPHLWVLVEGGGDRYFATLNVQSSKDAPGAPVEASFLYVLADNDFSHAILPEILARPEGLAPVEPRYGAGALDYIRGNLFDPRRMRALPASGPGSENLVGRISAQLGLARDQGHDILLFGNKFTTSPDQTTAVLGETPALGLDNVHMAQGDPPSVEAHFEENGVWHDGGCFIWDEPAKRMTAIFLAFQTQAWHTDDTGHPVAGETGCEAPRHEFSDGNLGERLELPPREAKLTSVHKSSSGEAVAVLANMSDRFLDLTGWRLLVNAAHEIPMPSQTIAPGYPLPLALPQELLTDAGGLLTIVDRAGLKVDGVSYRGGDGGRGWGASFAG